MAWPYSGTPSTHADVRKAIENLAASRVNVKDFGAVGVGRNMFNGSSTSGSSVIGGTFTSADVGSIAYLPGAGPSGGMLVGKIQSQTGSTATLNVTASASVSGQELEIVTDDTSAIQAAIDSLPTLGSYGHHWGGTVELPPGMYAVTTSIVLPQGVVLKGGGHKGSYEGFNSNPGTSIVAGVQGGITGGIIKNSPTASVQQTGGALLNLTIAGTSNSDRSSVGVSFVNFNRFLIRECTFTGLATGIYLSDGGGAPTNYAGGDSAWYQIENCTIYKVTTGISSTNTGTAGLIIGGDMSNCDVSCIDLQGSGVTVFRIIGTKVDHGGSAPAFKIKGYQGCVIGCDFEMTSTTTIAIDLLGDNAIGAYMGEGFQLIGNEIYYSTAAGVAAINLQATTKNCHVIGNALFNGTVTNSGTNNVLVNAATRKTVTGAKGGNAALTSLITALAQLGLITDSTT